MQTALVVGTVSATKKHASLIGQKLLVVQPRMSDKRRIDGDPLVAVDGVGAGIGDEVMITSDSQGARKLMQVDKTPVRWTIIGLCD